MSLQYVCVEHAVIIGTRKHFEVTNNTNCFCHKKCTVPAACNLYCKGLSSIENIWEILARP